MAFPRVIAALALAVAAALLVACPPQSGPTPVPPAPNPISPPQVQPDPITATPPGPTTLPGTPPPVASDGGADPDLVLGATGDSCDDPGDCESGVCEGQGCGARQGVCAPANRGCTRDLRPYCGCDGQTFKSSGSCAGKRYAYAGSCAAKKPDGTECLTGGDCASGVCSGQGCGADAPGRCQPRQRACTKDLAQYCGCDNQTFSASGSCPNQRFASKGACLALAPEGASCMAGGDCLSGVCEGEGCGTTAGVCAPAKRACLKDCRAYCGCDGKTFYGSSSCPGQRFAGRGVCH